MKKIFALALVGLFTVAFTENATAFDNDNDNIVYTVGEYEAPVDAIAFEIVPVTTDFVLNVTAETVSYLEGDIDSIAVNTDGFDLTVNSNSIAFADVPIDYGIRFIEFETNDPNELTDNGILSTNEYEQSEPLPDLTEYVKTYNETFGSTAPDLVRTIATNVGKLTPYNL